MYEGTQVIDVHGHMSTPPEFRAHGMGLIANRSPRGGNLTIPEERLRISAARHLEMMDERGIDLQMISPRPVAMNHWERPFIVHKWTTNTNDVIKQLCDMEPTRWLGIAQLPQNGFEDSSKCLKEFERCVNELGFVGALVNPDPHADRLTPGINDPYWYPLFEKSIELQAPLIIHPSISHDPRLDPIPASYQYNNLTEEVLCIALLKNTDVFERYPELKIIVCHCGGALERTLEDAPSSGQAGGGSALTSRAGAEAPRRPAKRDISQNLFVDSCAYDPWFLQAALKQWGPDRMLFGTEVPGTGTGSLNVVTNKPSDDLIPVLDSFDFLTKEDKLKILRENAIRVFPLLSKSAALKN